MTTATTPPSISRDALAPLLLRRFRNVVAVVLLATASYAVLHVAFDEPHLGWLLGGKLVQALAALGTYSAATRSPTRSVLVAALVALACVVHAVTGLTGYLLGDLGSTNLVFLMVVLASAAYLPWGAFAQGGTVVVAVSAATGMTLFGDPTLHGATYQLFTLTLAAAGSVLVAQEVEKDTLAEVHEEEVVHELAESRAALEGVYESSNVALGLVEVKGDDFAFVAANERLASQFRRTSTDLCGAAASAVGFSASDLRRWLLLFARALRDGPQRVASYRLEIFGVARWFEVSVSPIHDEERADPRFSIALVDITERIEAEARVRRFNRELESMVESRTAELETANRELEAFAYSVSHDLRTPLRSIEGFAAILETDYAEEFSDDARGQLSRIRIHSQKMSQLIDDLLTLSRVVRSDLHRERIDVTELVREVADELTAEMPTRFVNVRAAEGMTADADRRLLRIVLRNLLGNAWKYTARRGVARVEVGTEPVAGEVVFFVRDDGCGFDMRFVHKLFRPFQRLHAGTEFEGTGIGLATVARIVSRHGGRVEAEGQIDRGATFRFTLAPRPPSEEEVREAELRRSAQA